VARNTEYIVFDLEWNIVGIKNDVPPEEQKKLPFEIIEIGAVKLDRQLQEIGCFSTYVKPVLYPIMSQYVSRVTNRKQESLSQGLTFPIAAKHFRAFANNVSSVYCSWSKADPNVLMDNFRYYNLASIDPFRCMDIQSLFSVVAEKVSSSTQRSIEYALNYLQIPCDKPLHSALNDAYYTGLILNRIWQGMEGSARSKNRILKSFQYHPFVKRRR
jgi:DNA polymerase III epsilon subunit-like protein